MTRNSCQIDIEAGKIKKKYNTLQEEKMNEKGRRTKSEKILKDFGKG